MSDDEREIKVGRDYIENLSGGTVISGDQIGDRPILKPGNYYVDDLMLIVTMQLIMGTLAGWFNRDNCEQAGELFYLLQISASAVKQGRTETVAKNCMKAAEETFTLLTEFAAQKLGKERFSGFQNSFYEVKAAIVAGELRAV